MTVRFGKVWIHYGAAQGFKSLHPSDRNGYLRGMFMQLSDPDLAASEENENRRLYVTPLKDDLVMITGPDFDNFMAQPHFEQDTTKLGTPNTQTEIQTAKDNFLRKFLSQNERFGNIARLINPQKLEIHLSKPERLRLAQIFNESPIISESELIARVEEYRREKMVENYPHRAMPPLLGKFVKIIEAELDRLDLARQLGLPSFMPFETLLHISQDKK